MLEILEACMKVLEVKGVITTEEFERITKTLREKAPIDPSSLPYIVADCLNKTKE